MIQLSSATQKLIQRYQTSVEVSQVRPSEAVIHVDEIASKVASFYEKLRGVIDWKEEHLIRRTAIVRVLKRRLISKLAGSGLVPDLNVDVLAEALVSELIRGGHFLNDTIPEAKVGEIRDILYRYTYILENASITNVALATNIKERVNFFSRMLETAACEIEEVLAPPIRESGLIEFMTGVVRERLRIDSRLSISEEDIKIQTYIAVHRTLFRLDSPIIAYRLLRYHCPEWSDLSESVLSNITANIHLLWERIDNDLAHPFSDKFFRICERYDTPYMLLGDALDMLLVSELSSMPEKLTNPRVLEGLVREAYSRRLSTLKTRLFRMAIYSTVSILVGGAFSLFIVEVPLAKLIYEKFNPLAIVIDLSVPPILMFFLVARAKLPSESNLEKAVAEVVKITYEQEGETTFYEMKFPKKRGIIFNFIIHSVYTLGCILSLGFVVWLFYIVRTPVTSTILNTINVAIVVFAGLIIRQRAKELTVEDEKLRLVDFFFSTLPIPVAKLGKWMAKKWEEYNIINVFLMVLIDTPFMVFTEFVEAWSTFVKEKKESLHS